MLNTFPNYAVFTNNKYIASKKPFATWYDGTPFCNGRGQVITAAFIDMNLSKEVITNVVIPACCFVENDNVFIFDEQQDKFTKTTINNILSILQ